MDCGRHPPILFRECVRVTVTYLEVNEWFPRTWNPAQPGKLVHEGGTTQELGPQKFLYRTQASHALDPTILRATSETLFESAESAVIHYLKWDLGLHGKLDGWKVID